MKIVFLDRQTIRPDIIIRPPGFAHDWINYDTSTEEQVRERCHDADIIITNKVPLSRITIESLPSLRMVAVAATGVDPIDIRACSKKGIIVSNIRNYALTTVPEHVISLILSLRRQIPQYRQQVLNGRWQAENNFCFFDRPIYDIAGATLGIIGYGALGQATARLAHKVGMKVQYYSPHTKEPDFSTSVDFDTLLKTSDVISCHCLLNSHTNHLINANAIEKMKPEAILINTARGAIIDEQALANALINQNIAGAGIDVLPQEPPAADSPMMKIAHQTNVILTPHIAWASQQAMQALSDQLIDNIEAFVNGTPRNIVNSE